MPDTFGAKQVATRIGTDPKTFRKFLRSEASPYEAVGQGGRYEFPKGDIEEIKKAFLSWRKGVRPKRPSTPKPKVDPDSARRTREAAGMELIDELDKPERDWDIEFTDYEPSESDLDAIEDEELDIDE